MFLKALDKDKWLEGLFIEVGDRRCTNILNI